MNRLPLFILLTFLICSTLAAETGSPCLVDDDCPDLHTCTGTKTLTCVHKPLFPINVREVIGTIIILVLNALLTAGGIGGGAAYVPYVILLFSTTLSRAINLAYLCVFGGGLGNLTSVITLKNPKTKRYMTNYNLNMIILPALMTGVMIGVILQRIFAPIVTHIILLLTLAFSIYKNFEKLKANIKKEKKERAENRKQELAKTEEKTAFTSTADPKADKELVTVSANTNEHTSSETETAQVSDPYLEQRNKLYKKEEKFPFRKIAEISLNLVVIILIGIIRGSKTFRPIVDVDWTCGWDFIWFAIAIVLYGFVLARSVYLVIKWQKEKQKVGYEFLPEEPLLNTRAIVRIVIVSIIAGLIGAIVALGGALMIAPTLLDLGLPPAVNAATSSVYMIFAMFNTALIAILSNKVTGLEIAWFVPLAFVFSFTSSKLMNWYVRKTGKQSTIIMSITLVVVLGFLCLLAVMIRDLVLNTQAQIKFTSVC